MVGMIDFSQVDPNGANALARGFMASQDRQNQMQQQARANKLADLQYNSANRAEQNALAEEQVYKNNQDPAQIAAQLRAAGLGKQAMAADKSMMEYKAAQLTRAKGIYDLTKTATGAIVANPTLATATAALQGLAQTAGVDVSQYAQELAQIGENPEAIRAWAAGHSMDADKLLPKFEKFDQGAAVVTGSVDPLTGKFVQGQAFQKTQTPDSTAQIASRESEGAKNRQVQRRGQDIQLDPTVVASTTIDETGKVTHFNKRGEVIGAPVQAGKPSATFEKTKALRAQQVRDINLAIPELEKITKDGGLIDQSTGSGAGRAYDMAAGFFGSAPEGAIAIGKLKPIADIALKMVPRFEGPQSDKDTLSYKEAAGQLADPTLPTIIRKNAGKEVLRIMKARKDQFVNAEMAAEGTSPKAASGGVDTSNPLLK